MCEQTIEEKNIGKKFSMPDRVLLLTTG